jgi:hypothetical protein
LIDEANLQIKKAQGVSEKRGEAFRLVKQAALEMRDKFDKMERELRNPRTNESRVGELLEEFRTTLNTSFTSFETVQTV